ncbi:MAG: hypothetical protein EHM33_21460 [Chloroflexi bacterium]|nr:MAG: hypothetical protein EHM33_21460 [Chloroflexota bacterium]
MRSVKLALLAVGVIQLVLAAGFFFQQAWATALWPLPDTPLSYAFIAAILAGSGAPLIWIGLSGRLGGLTGYGMSFGIMYAGMGSAAVLFYLREQQPALAWFALVMGILAVMGAFLFFSSRRHAADSQPTPRIVRLAFALEILVLAGAGILLILKVPNTLPWNISPESSVLYGWVFLGLAFYYLYAVLIPRWIHALGPLLGFLVYDLVLFWPLFARFGNIQPEHMRGQITASIIIIFSALLGIYYLFVNPATRLGTQSDFKRNLP